MAGIFEFLILFKSSFSYQVYKISEKSHLTYHYEETENEDENLISIKHIRISFRINFTGLWTGMRKNNLNKLVQLNSRIIKSTHLDVTKRKSIKFNDSVIMSEYFFKNFSQFPIKIGNMSIKMNPCNRRARCSTSKLDT